MHRVSCAFVACLALPLFGCGITSFPEPTHRDSTGSDGSGGTSPDGAQGAGCNGSKPFPSTPVLDSFERSDGAVGADWLGNTAGFSVRNAAVSGTTVGGDSMYFHESFGGEQEVYATLEAFDPELYDMSLLLKGQSPTEGCPSLRVRYANGYTSLHSVLVTQCEGSTYTILLDHDVPLLHPGARLGARVSANGCVEVFMHDADPGGAPVGFDFLDSVDAARFSAIAFPGYLGLYSQVKKSEGPGVACVWDDFGGGTLN